MNCSCIKCKKVFSYKGIHTHFMREHEKSGNFKSVSGRYKCWDDPEFIQKNKDRVERITEKKHGKLKNFTVNCGKCSAEITVAEREKKFPSKEKYFCSRSCANSRPQKDETKKKISNRLKGNKPHNKGSGLTRGTKQNRECPTCGNDFVTIVPSKQKYCCTDCRPKVPGGYRPGSGRAKTGYYKGIYCGSTYELAWVIYNIDNGIPVERFSGYLELDGIKYFPDFLLEGKIIEIKGYEDDSVEKKTKVANHYGYEVVLLKKNDLTEQFDWVKSHYSYKKIYELYDDYKPKYEYTCPVCGNIFSRNKKSKTKVTLCSLKCSGKNLQIQKAPIE